MMKTKTDPVVTALLVLAVAFAVIVLADPALAAPPRSGFETVTEDLWNWLIENVILAAIVFGALGGIAGGLIAQPGRGVATVLICFLLGSFAASIPAWAEWALSVA